MALQVALYRCSNLNQSKESNKCDAYVMFEVAGQPSQQSSVKYGNVNPVWDPPETFVFQGVTHLWSSLRITVKDKDFLSDMLPDNLGSCSVFCNELPPGEPVRMQKSLQHGAVIDISITWFPDGMAGHSPSAEAKLAKSVSPSDAQKHAMGSPSSTQKPMAAGWAPGDGAYGVLNFDPAKLWVANPTVPSSVEAPTTYIVW